MKKVIFNNSRDLKLVGNIYSVNSKSIIIMCHGFTSDKHSKGRFDRLAKELNSIGYDVFTFDFSGCGESDDDILSVNKEVDDLKSAINFVKSNGYKEIALYGHSLGTLICLKCYTSEINTMVLTGALTDSMKYDWNKVFTKEEMKELNKNGYMKISTSSKQREIITIDDQTLKDFESINQKELLKNIRCPVLIIHGNNDEEEKLLSKRSKEGIKLLSSDSKLKIIDGANHSFIDHFDILIELCKDWYTKHFKVV